MVEDIDTTIERNEVHLAVESQEPQSAIKVQIALKTSEKDEDELLKEGIYVQKGMSKERLP